MQYKISQELAQAILNYLVARPYIEVYQAVIALQQLEPIGENGAPLVITQPDKEKEPAPEAQA